jgi:hypothetical protein
MDMKTRKRWFTAIAATVVLVPAAALAKLPAPSDEAKAKAAEAAAKTNWTNQVANFQLCKSMDQVAAGYLAQAKKTGKETKPVVATPACADPGAFVYVPPAPASAASGAAAGAAPATVTAAAPAANPAPKAPVKK